MSPIPTAALPAPPSCTASMPLTSPRASAPKCCRQPPVILRGLVKDWPVVQAAQVSDQAVCEYPAVLFGRIITHARRPSSRPPPVLPRRHGRAHLRAPADRTSSTACACCSRTPLTPRPLPSTWTPCPARLLAAVGEALQPPLMPSGDAAHLIGNAVRVQTHFDLAQNLACVVAGRRRFTLFLPEQLPNLYIGPIDFTPAGPPVSMVDLEAPDHDRYPLPRGPRPRPGRRARPRRRPLPALRLAAPGPVPLRLQHPHQLLVDRRAPAHQTL